MTDYTVWADSTAYDMRDYYEANRPLRWWEKRNPPGSWGCISDELMLGLLDIAVMAERKRTEAPHDDKELCERLELLESDLLEVYYPGASAAVSIARARIQSLTAENKRRGEALQSILTYVEEAIDADKPLDAILALDAISDVARAALSAAGEG